MKTPVIVAMSYPPGALEAWRKKDCTLLTASRACDFIKKILSDKVARRSGGRRFFGEAYVAARIPHRAGYYGSFKWLSNPRFANNQPFPNSPTKAFQEELRTALLKHFGKNQLDRLRTRSQALEARSGMRPMAPDLWLVDRHGNHHFIEVKLPGDRIAPAQRAGMMLINSCLRPKGRLSIELAVLSPEHDREPPEGRANKRLQPTAPRTNERRRG